VTNLALSEQGLSRAEGAGPTATTRALEERLQEAENQVCVQGRVGEGREGSSEGGGRGGGEKDIRAERGLGLVSRRLVKMGVAAARRGRGWWQRRGGEAMGPVMCVW